MRSSGIASYTKIYEKQYLYLSEDYIITKSKGMYKKRVVMETCFEKCNASYHLHLIGPSLAGIFAGSFILERMFAIPGLDYSTM